MKMIQDIALRPQPVGVFPLPVGLLLLPPVDAPCADALASLLRADHAAVVPPEWRFYVRALSGDMSVPDHSDDPLAAYNRFVLSGDPEQYRELLTTADGDLATMLELAAFYHGLTDTLPDSTSLTGELRAQALMMFAAQSIEQQDTSAALKHLTEAVDLARPASPVFAATLLGQMAQLGSGSCSAFTFCREAIDLLADCADDRLRAEAWMHLGQVCQEQAGASRVVLVEAAQAYQQALRHGLSLECNEDLYALAQNNIGLAYLAMPMTGAGDNLRTGVAIQSFREALKVYDRERNPDLWVSTQLNLANALQYMHSSHPEENLMRAVEIYEELLSMRQRAIDPVGYARILANQANALAHLGLFSPAMEKATEAHKLLHWHNEPNLAATMLDLTTQINSRLGQSANAGAN